MRRLAKVYPRLMWYALFMGILGGIASFIGPPRHGLTKAMIGVTVGAMLLGNMLPEALKPLREILKEIAEDIFQE